MSQQHPQTTLLYQMEPRLLAWAMTCAGLGLGLIVASFVGKDTPVLLAWGTGLLTLGVVVGTTQRYLKRRSREQ